jgi:hypothetical protein
MKYIFSLLLIAAFIPAFSQLKQHKIVWDVNSKDTIVHSMVLRQINNVLNAAPDTKIEVVFHGYAITELVTDSSFFADKIKTAQGKGVVFAACNNSLKRVKIDPSLVLPGVVVVPVAILELSTKQQEGWSYIKAGE